MTTSNVKLAVEILKSTTEFHIGQLEYREEPEKLIIWNKGSTGCFFSISITPHFAQWSRWIGYNAYDQRCELHIF